MTELPSHLRFPAWHSLRRRLPALISALIAVMLVTFLWAAHATLESTLLRASGERLQTAANQLARLLSRRSITYQTTDAAADETVTALVRHPSEDTRDRARRYLMSLASNNPRRVEVWDDSGERLLELDLTSSQAAGRAALPPSPRPTAAGRGPLQVVGGAVVYDTIVEIDDAAAAEGSRRLGFLVLRASFPGTDPQTISGLVGTNAVALVGNRDGRLWTDLARPVPGPDADLHREGVTEYVDRTGERRMGALAHVVGAPWIAWVEFPRAHLLAPASAFLERMIPLALLFLATTAVIAWRITSRVTGPIADLSDASQAVAAGDYSRRVAATGADEVGRLAHAFNTMTAQIHEAQLRLEARVAERTQELAAARQEADRANRAKSEFLSLMSHDLRTPLNAVLGFGQLLENDALTPEQTEYVGQILSAGRHLLDLISDVLDITRIESGQLSLSREPVAVREIVQSALDLLKPMAAERRVRLDVETPAADDAVMADRQRLAQVLINLMANAVKYNRKGGRVSVKGERIGANMYRISVSDTGRGIPEAQMRKLFMPFERLGAEQSGVEGTGLGLALSRALAEAMGGSIGVTSVPGAGSTFWVDLAVAELPAGRSAHPQPRHVIDTRTVPAALVLYVEDNRSNVRLVERILQRRPGIELVHAPTGEAGIRLAHERRPDLVLLDLHLPDMGGEEVLRSLAAEPATRDIPKIVVTADAGTHLARRLEAEGAAGYLTKPLDIAEMLRKIDDVLDPRDNHG